MKAHELFLRLFQKEATNLDIPAIYAAALAAGSNWWQTPEYMGSRGHRVTTAEADMMIEKAYFCYDKHMAAKKLDFTLERDADMGFGFVAGSEKPVIVR